MYGYKPDSIGFRKDNAETTALRRIAVDYNVISLLERSRSFNSDSNKRTMLDLIEQNKDSNGNQIISEIRKLVSERIKEITEDGRKAIKEAARETERLIGDLSADTSKDIASKASSMVLAPVITTVTDRLLVTSLIVASNSNGNLIASTDDSVINLGKTNDSFEIWSKIHYNYNRNTRGESIHVRGITLGVEYSFKDNKYKTGLAYTLSSGNGSEYIANSISLYSGINNIDIKNFKNNFVNVIFTYGRLNVKKVKNRNKSVAIEHKYITNLISLNTVFGHNIILSNNNGIVTPILGIRYDYINRNAYTNNAGLNYGKISMNIFTPVIGVSYAKSMLNDTLTIKVGTKLGYGFNLNKNSNMIVKVGTNNNSRTISYINNNALNSDTNFGLTYKVKKDIELSLDANISIDTNRNFGAGFSFGRRYKF